MNRWKLSILAVSFVASSANALDSISYAIHHSYQTPRALGMGDAFTALADDYSAIFYNPAALARREDGQVNLSMNFAVGTDFMKFYKDVDAIGKSGASESQKQTDYFNLIEANYGKSYSLRTAPVEGIWVRPKWGIAVIPADVSMELSMHKQLGPAINTTVYVDTTVALAYADDIKSVDNGRLSWGLTGKFINRGFASKSISASQLAGNPNLISADDLTEGYTVDADLGFLWTPELPDQGLWSLVRLARPTFALVARNLGETGFNSSLKLINKNSVDHPEKNFRVYDLGTRWEYPSAWIFGGRGVLDIRDIGHPNFNMRKGLHAGFEFDWSMTNWWKGAYRVGVNQGFLSLGASAELGIFNLDAVTYGEDIGTYSTPRENRIYALKLNMDF